MDALRQAFTQFRGLLNNMPPGARLQLIVIPLVVLAGLGLLLHNRTSSDEEALLMGKSFSAEELRNAQAALQKAGLQQFRVADQRLLVSRSDAARYNAALLTSDGGLPDSFGKEFHNALDTNPFTAGTGTQRHDRMDLARAQVLTKMVKAIAYVEDAQIVWYRAPGRGLQSSGKATAVLTVKPRAGRELTGAQARTLQQAVAGCFGMQADDVMVLDSSTGHAVQSDAVEDPGHTATLQAVRDYTLHYQQVIASALKDIPDVQVSVHPDIAPVDRTGSDNRVGATARDDSSDLACRAVHASISIPRDYITRQQQRQLSEGQSPARMSAARQRRLQADLEQEIQRRVARLLPQPVGSRPADCVTVTAYDRELPETTPRLTARLERLLAATPRWVAPVCVIAVGLWSLWQVSRSGKSSPPVPGPSPAHAVLTPVSPTSTSPTPPPAQAVPEVLEPLQQLVNDHPVLAAGVIRDWLTTGA